MMLRKLMAVALVGGLMMGAGSVPVQAANSDQIALRDKAQAELAPVTKSEPQHFNSYWFVYGVPPYKGGIEPWKRSQVQDPEDPKHPEFNPYWFVYGVPPYKGGVEPWKRPSTVKGSASEPEKQAEK